MDDNDNTMTMDDEKFGARTQILRKVNPTYGLKLIEKRNNRTQLK